MIVSKKLPEKHKSSAVDLLLNALGDKFTPILGKNNKAKQLLVLSINIDNCLSVKNETGLLGFLAFQTNGASFLNPKLRTIISVYGLLGGIKKAIGLSLLKHKTKPNEIYIEAVAVNELCRGKGIGTKLLDALFVFSKEKGYKTITLEVIDTNLRAIELYEKIGFKIVKQKNISPINKLIDWSFNEVFLMKKNIN